MFFRPLASLTYSTKSARLARGPSPSCGPECGARTKRARNGRCRPRARHATRRRWSWRVIEDGAVRRAPLHDLAREPHAVGVRVGGQPERREPLASGGVLDEHASARERLNRLVDDAIDERPLEHLETRSHNLLV